MYEVDPETFDGMVARAIERLPAEFATRIANVEFSVEDEARPEDYARIGNAGHLLGVYRGVPLTRRGAGYNLVVPDRIVIFRVALQRISSDEGDLEQRIEHVVRHEVAHYFGISDERLREIDAY
jgi:predicted Zn-dependent protease with MMP-like domain